MQMMIPEQMLWVDTIHGLNALTSPSKTQPLKHFFAHVISSVTLRLDTVHLTIFSLISHTHTNNPWKQPPSCGCPWGWGTERTSGHSSSHSHVLRRCSPRRSTKHELKFAHPWTLAKPDATCGWRDDAWDLERPWQLQMPHNKTMKLTLEQLGYRKSRGWFEDPTTFNLEFMRLKHSFLFRPNEKGQPQLHAKFKDCTCYN